MGIVNSYTYMLAYTNNGSNWSYAFPGEIDAVLEKKPSKIRYYMRSNKFCGNSEPHVVSFSNDFNGIKLKDSCVDISNVLTYASKNIVKPKFDFKNAFKGASFDMSTNKLPLVGTYTYKDKYKDKYPSFDEIAATPFNWAMYSNASIEGDMPYSSANSLNSIFEQTFYPKSIEFNSAYVNSSSGYELPICIEQNGVDMLNVDYSTAYVGKNLKFIEYDSSKANAKAVTENAYLSIEGTSITPTKLGTTYLKCTFDFPYDRPSISTKILWLVINGQKVEGLDLFLYKETGDTIDISTPPSSPTYIYCGQSLKIYPKISPSNAANKAVYVSLNDNSLLNYLVEPLDESDEYGYDNNAVQYVEFTGISSGNAIATFTTSNNDEAIAKSLNITVKDVYAESMDEISPSTLSLPEGQTSVQTVTFYGKEITKENDETDKLAITYFSPSVNSNNTSNVDASIKSIQTILKNAAIESNCTKMDITITPKLKSTGTAITIQAKRENGTWITSTITVNVIDKLSGLTLNYSLYKMDIGETIKIIASMVIENADGTYSEPDNYDWELEFDSNFYEIIEPGLLKINGKYPSLANGGREIDITAFADDMKYDWVESPIVYLWCKAKFANGNEYNAACAIIVNAIMPTEITLPESLEIGLAETKELATSFMPENCTFKKINWNYGTEYVSIDEDNEKYKITGFAPTPRYTNVMANCNGISKTITVTVGYPEVNVTFDESEITLNLKQSYKIIYKLTSTPDGYVEYANLTWSSSNTYVASVDTNGIVTAHQKGTTIISCKPSLGNEKTIKVSVKTASDEELLLSQTNVSIDLGETTTVVATIAGEPATSLTIEGANNNTWIDSVKAIESNGNIIIKAKDPNASEASQQTETSKSCILTIKSSEESQTFTASLNVTINNILPTSIITQLDGITLSGSNEITRKYGNKYFLNGSSNELPKTISVTGYKNSLETIYNSFALSSAIDIYNIMEIDNNAKTIGFNWKDYTIAQATSTPILKVSCASVTAFYGFVIKNAMPNSISVYATNLSGNELLSTISNECYLVAKLNNSPGYTVVNWTFSTNEALKLTNDAAEISSSGDYVYVKRKATPMSNSENMLITATCGTVSGNTNITVELPETNEEQTE